MTLIEASGIDHGPATLDRLQRMVAATRQRHCIPVSPAVALLDACAELGELAGAYLKDAGYRVPPAGGTGGPPADRVRAEFGDALFALLSFADAVGLSAATELTGTMASYDARFAGSAVSRVESGPDR